MIDGGEEQGLLTGGVMSSIPAAEAIGALQAEQGRWMDAGLWLTFLVAATALLILPGPDWAFMLASGVRGGGVAAPVLGLSIGYVVVAFVVAAGIGPLIAAVPLALTAVTLVGAIYLIVLGIGVLRAPRPDVGSLVSSDAAEAALAAPSARSMICQGATVSALNAKSLVFFVAFLPQFVSTAASLPLWMQLATLGLTWAAMAAVFNVFLGVASRRLLTGQPTAAGIISRITGIAMVAMGLWLVAERIWALVAHSG